MKMRPYLSPSNACSSPFNGAERSGCASEHHYPAPESPCSPSTHPLPCRRNPHGSQTIAQSHNQEDGLTQTCPLSRGWQERHPGPPRGVGVGTWELGGARKLSNEPFAHGDTANKAEEVKPGRWQVAAARQ